MDAYSLYGSSSHMVATCFTCFADLEQSFHPLRRKSSNLVPRSPTTPAPSFKRILQKLDSKVPSDLCGRSSPASKPGSFSASQCPMFIEEIAVPPSRSVPQHPELESPSADVLPSIQLRRSILAPSLSRGPSPSVLANGLDARCSDVSGGSAADTSASITLEQTRSLVGTGSVSMARRANASRSKLRSSSTCVDVASPEPSHRPLQKAGSNIRHSTDSFLLREKFPQFRNDVFAFESLEGDSGVDGFVNNSVEPSGPTRRHYFPHVSASTLSTDAPGKVNRSEVSVRSKAPIDALGQQPTTDNDAVKPLLLSSVVRDAGEPSSSKQEAESLTKTRLASWMSKVKGVWKPPHLWGSPSLVV